MNLITEAESKVGVYDIRFLNKTTSDSWIDDQMRDFLYDAQLFNFLVPDGTLAGCIKDLMLTNEKLKLILNEEWNSNLPAHKNLKRQIEEVLGKDSENNNENEDNDNSQKKTKKKGKENVFVKITANKKFDLIEKIKCKHCP